MQNRVAAYLLQELKIFFDGFVMPKQQQEP